ncbi:MAG: cation transporter, partial [Planctomycetes bacterium]|nr:cation transporter [Planctomycetota bacterium]
MKLGKLNISILNLMLVFVPICIVMKMMRADEVWIFTIACLAIVPLAGWMGKATEHL